MDRHLLALRLQANNMPGAAPGTASAQASAVFDDPIFTHASTWALSTSNVSAPWLSSFGFGPVCDHGYGLGYMITDDDVRVHVTSWVDHPDTSTAAMKEAIIDSLRHIQKIKTEEVAE